MKLKRKIMKLTGLLVAINITLLITGCASSKIEYTCPDLFWTDFPELNTEYEDETNRVYMDLDEYEKIFKFKNWYEAQKEYYFRIKNLYEGVSDENRSVYYDEYFQKG